MKHKLLLAFILVMIAGLCNSQTWTTLNPTTQRLNGIVFSTEMYGVAVGCNGVLFISTDGGASWQQRSSGTIDDLNAVDYTDGGQTLYAVGGLGTIIKSQTSGNGWAPLTSGTTDALFGVDCMGSFVIAVGVGSTLLKSTDGISWNSIAYEEPFHLAAVSMVNVWVGYAAGNDGLIIKTADSGDHWQEIYVGNITQHFTSVSFASEQLGSVVGCSSTILTTNNGFSMSYLVQSPGYSDDFNDVFFVDDYTGYIVGNNGLIMKTTNSGETWVNISYGSTNYKSVFFITPDIGWIVGENGTIMKTTTGGVSAVDEYESYAVSAYPNPVKDLINIESELGTDFEIQINNIAGSRVLYSQSDFGKCQVDMAQLSSGVYIISINSGEKKAYFKCIKE